VTRAPATLALVCLIALASAGCGRYGPPERSAPPIAPEATVSAPASESEIPADDRDEESSP